MKKLLLMALLVPTVVLAEPATPKLQLDKTLETHSIVADEQASKLTASADLPTPNLILERGLVYTPTTRIKTRIISGGINISQFRAIPESEYWRGN